MCSPCSLCVENRANTRFAPTITANAGREYMVSVVRLHTDGQLARLKETLTIFVAVAFQCAQLRGGHGTVRDPAHLASSSSGIRCPHVDESRAECASAAPDRHRDRPLAARAKLRALARQARRGVAKGTSAIRRGSPCLCPDAVELLRDILRVANRRTVGAASLAAAEEEGQGEEPARRLRSTAFRASRPGRASGVESSGNTSGRRFAGWGHRVGSHALVLCLGTASQMSVCIPGQRDPSNVARSGSRCSA